MILTNPGRGDIKADRHTALSMNNQSTQHFTSSLCREKGALPQEVSQSGGSARTCAVSPGSIIYSTDYAETGRKQ